MEALPLRAFLFEDRIIFLVVFLWDYLWMDEERGRVLMLLASGYSLLSHCRAHHAVRVRPFQLAIESLVGLVDKTSFTTTQ